MIRFDHGGNIYKASQRGGIVPTALLDCSANINPKGMHPLGKVALLDAVERCVHYPDPDASELRTVITETYGVPSSYVALGNGAAELIYALATLPKVDHIVVTAPAFSEYAHAATAHHLPITILPTKLENHFAVQPSDLSNMTAEGALLFLGHPNNPDGQLLEEDTLRCALDMTAGCGYVAVDESFIDFIGDTASYRSWLIQYPHLIIIHSYTKFYAVPGLRLGAVYANPEVIEAIQRVIPAWSVNTLAQAYGTIALADGIYQEESRKLMQLEREWVYEKYLALPCVHPIPPSANFMLMSWKADVPLQELESALFKDGILIRNASSYDNLQGEWFRIAIRNREDNERVYCAIVHFLERKGYICQKST